MICKLFYVFCLIVLSALTTFGNSPLRFTHYSSYNGLPNDFVLSITQDSNGFIWFGTHLGVVQFDGHNFNLYQPNQNTNSISYKHISELYCDLHDNLWIKFTESALNRMDTKTGEIFKYLPDSTKSTSLATLRVTKFYEDRDSVLWLGTNIGLYTYNNTNNEFHSISHKPDTGKSSPGNYIKNMAEDSLGYIWFLSTKGIGRINKKTFEIKTLGQVAGNPDIDSLLITNFASDKQSKIWFTTKNKGVFVYDILTEKLTNYFENLTSIKYLFCDSKGNTYVFSDRENSLFIIEKTDLVNQTYSYKNLFNTSEAVSFLMINEDKTGNLWISSSHGLDMFSKKTGLIHYKSDPIKKQSISSNLINLTFIDETNNLWVSNYRLGLDKADLNQKPFDWNFTTKEQANNAFLSSNITSVLVDSNNFLWVGASGNSIIRYDKNTNDIKTIKVKENKKHMFSALFEDSEGDIWVGNYNGLGIDKIDPKTLNIKQTFNFTDNGGITESISSVRKFVEDKQKNIWFVTKSGINKWERKTNKVIPYSALYDKHNPDHGFYRTVYIDKEDILWSGSYNGGLARYDIQTNTVKRYINIPGETTSISGNGVYAIYEESDSTFLIGTSFGLNRFNKKSEQFSLVKTNASIYNYGIYTIIPDSLNNYWLATDNGLICLNKITNACTFYNEFDGLLANEFNTTASCVDLHGNIYLGCPKGLLSFNPKNFTNNPYNARPKITNLEIKNKPISAGDTLNSRVLLKKQIWITKVLELKYHENDFTLQFSAMHFAAPENNQFWYKLDGYKNEWVLTNANRPWASFIGLPPGTYYFKLKASNNDGLICNPEDEVSLKIIIHPPFWLTLWFKISFIIFIACVIGIFFRLRIIQLKKHNLLLDQKVKERTVELHEANISLHEQQDEISAQKESLEKANETLRKTQQEIIVKNKELDEHKNRLELLVKARTSELEKALEKVKESDRLKSSFLANMSHEIRTPMNAIVGFSLLLRNDNIDDVKKRSYFETIIKNSQALLELIDNILDLSKIQTNQMEFYFSEYNVYEIVNEIYKIYSLEAIKKKIPLKLNVEKINSDFTIITDKNRFKQVLSNLLSNAVKFTNTGLIEFGIYEVLEVSGEIVFYVKDTGIGIAKNTGNSIFERFLKIEENKNNLYRGVGLGLAISKSIVNSFGGKLWFESVENTLTTFYFTHPLNQLRSSELTDISDENFVNYNFKGITILIAEDEESNFDLLQEYLIETEATIIWTKNGIETCEITNSHKIDLILMDIMMPQMDGIEASKIIKQKLPKIPIIALTAYAHKNMDNLVAQNIFDIIIIKPINRNNLLQLINKYLQYE